MSDENYPHLKEFKFEDYAKRALEQEGKLEEEINEAQNQRSGS